MARASWVNVCAIGNKKAPMFQANLGNNVRV